MRFKPSTIREGRNKKRLAKEEGVNLQGRNSGRFMEEARPSIESAITELVIANRDWIEDELAEAFGDFCGERVMTLSDVITVFQATFEKRLKLVARLEGDRPESLVEDDSRFAFILDQAVFDFIMSLRKSKLRGDSLLQSISLAELSHWLDPCEIDRLVKKYGGGVDASVIKTAALHYPKGPDTFIDNYVTE